MRWHVILWKVPVGAQSQGVLTALPVPPLQRMPEMLLCSTADAVPTNDILLAIPQALPNCVLQHRREYCSRISEIVHEIPIALATHTPAPGYLFRPKHSCPFAKCDREGRPDQTSRNLVRDRVVSAQLWPLQAGDRPAQRPIGTTHTTHRFRLAEAYQFQLLEGQAGLSGGFVPVRRGRIVHRETGRTPHA